MFYGKLGKSSCCQRLQSDGSEMLRFEAGKEEWENRDASFSRDLEAKKAIRLNYLPTPSQALHEACNLLLRLGLDMMFSSLKSPLIFQHGHGVRRTLDRKVSRYSGPSSQPWNTAWCLIF